MKYPVWTVLLAAIPLIGCSSSERYVFRNDVRPVYASTIDVATLKSLENDPRLVLLDVRLQEDYAANAMLIPGANYRNPENIQTWASALPENSKVVVYCVGGRWVSQKAAHFLNEQGFETYSLAGGIDAWQEAEE